MPKELSHEPDARRYVLRIDGVLVAIVDYAERADSVSFTRTYTSPAFRGRGHAAEVVDYAATEVERNSTRRIVPMCWYVSDWFESHPDRAGLLTR